MKVTYDDKPADDGQSDAYAPKALPGFENVATPIQGLLWADIGEPGKRKRPKAQREVKGPTLFDCQPKAKRRPIRHGVCHACATPYAANDGFCDVCNRQTCEPKRG
jgi:hypothetical protein